MSYLSLGQYSKVAAQTRRTPMDYGLPGHKEANLMTGVNHSAAEHDKALSKLPWMTVAEVTKRFGDGMNAFMSFIGTKGKPDVTIGPNIIAHKSMEPINPGFDLIIQPGPPTPGFEGKLDMLSRINCSPGDWLVYKIGSRGQERNERSVMFIVNEQGEFLPNQSIFINAEPTHEVMPTIFVGNGEIVVPKSEIFCTEDAFGVSHPKKNIFVFAINLKQQVFAGKHVEWYPDYEKKRIDSMVYKYGYPNYNGVNIIPSDKNLGGVFSYIRHKYKDLGIVGIHYEYLNGKFAFILNREMTEQERQIPDPYRMWPWLRLSHAKAMAPLELRGMHGPVDQFPALPPPKTAHKASVPPAEIPLPPNNWADDIPDNRTDKEKKLEEQVAELKQQVVDLKKRVEWMDEHIAEHNDLKERLDPGCKDYAEKNRLLEMICFMPARTAYCRELGCSKKYTLFKCPGCAKRVNRDKEDRYETRRLQNDGYVKVGNWKGKANVNGVARSASSSSSHSSSSLSFVSRNESGIEPNTENVAVDNVIGQRL